MQQYYPLTAAQKMHHNWILKYKTQQVSGVSVVASLKAPLDFGLFKKCIQLELERYGCMRVRFTKPDKNGEVKQYIVEKDTRDIPLKDLSNMSMADADNLMQQWAYETFDGDDIPMCEVTVVKLPEDGSVLYDVWLGNTKFAEYTLFKNGDNWDYTSADLNDQLFVKTHSVKVVVPERAEVRANGEILGGEYVSAEEYTVHDFDDLDDKSLIPRFTVYDTGAIFISEPEVRVYGENGNELVISKEKKTLHALPEPTAEQLAEIKAAAEESALAYAMYITQDTSFEPLKKYLIADSELYRRIKDFHHDWYRDHTTTYDNVVFSDIVMYDEGHFTLHIEFDYHVNIGYRVNDYEVEYTMSMIKLDGEWKIAGMIM